MAKINGIEGMDRATLANELQRGGRFVVYQYVISVLVMTFRRGSDIYYLAPGESAVPKGLPFTLLSFFLGWWGFPWGFIYTPGAIFKNFSGGIDVTREVAAELLGGGYAVAVAAQPAPPVAPPLSMDVVVAKRTYTWPDRVGYYITFQRHPHAPAELEVSPEWYQVLNPGDAGTLTLNNGLFWGFQKNG